MPPSPEQRSAAAELGRRGLAECWEILRVHGKTFHMMAKLLGPERGSDIAALYGFARVADDAVDVPTPGGTPAAVRAKLAWMQEELRRAVAWRERRAALRRARRDGARHAIPLQPFDDLLAGLLMDLDGARYRTFADLELYCYRVAGTVGLMITPVAGYHGGAEALEHAKTLGTAMQLTNILRDVGEDLALGRVYLPDEDLETFGLGEGHSPSGASTAASAPSWSSRSRGPAGSTSAGSRSSRSSPTRAAGWRSSSPWTPTPPSSRRSARTATTSSAAARASPRARSSRSSPAPCGARRSPAATRATVRTATAAAGGTATTDARSERGARPVAEDALASAARGAAAAAQEFLFRIQRDGHWRAELESNVTITAEYVLLRQALGLDLSARRDGIVRHLSSHQKADGAGDRAKLPGDVSTRSETYLALRLLGRRREDDRGSAAERFIRTRAASRTCASSPASTSPCSASSRGTRCPPSRPR